MDRFELSMTQPDIFANTLPSLAPLAHEESDDLRPETPGIEVADGSASVSEISAQCDSLDATPSAEAGRRASRLRGAVVEAVVPVAVGATVMGYALAVLSMSRFDRPGAKEQGPDNRSAAQVGIDLATANLKRATEKYGKDSPQAQAAAANLDHITAEGIAAGQDTTPSSDD